MSVHAVAPHLPVWDESFFRDLVPATVDDLVPAPGDDLVPAPADVRVWPTRPSGRASTATAAALTVGAIGGVAVITQAMVTGSIPLPMALGPALGVAPHPAITTAPNPAVHTAPHPAVDTLPHPPTASPTGADVDPAHSPGSISDSSNLDGPELVRDSDTPTLDRAAGYHTWQPPRLARAKGGASSSPGRHQVSDRAHGPQRVLGNGDSSWLGHRPDRAAGWERGRGAGAATGGHSDAGRHHADNPGSGGGQAAGGNGYQGAGRHSAGDGGSAAGNREHGDRGQTPQRGGESHTGGPDHG